MVQVIADSTMIDGLVWTIVAVVCVLVILIVERVIHNYRTTRDATNVDNASHRKTPLALAMGLDQYADLVSIDQVTPEGLVEAKHGKGKNKTTVEYQLPENKNAQLPQVTEGKSPEKTRSIIQLLFNSVSKHQFLRGAKVPVVGLVWDKAIAVGLPGLGVLAYMQKMERVQNFDKQIEELKADEKYKEVGEWIEQVKSCWSVIDFNAVRNHFPFAWDQTRRSSQNQWHEQLGERRNKHNQDSFKSLCLYLGVLLIGVAALIAVCAIFF
jgi:hypothetical protein